MITGGIRPGGIAWSGELIGGDRPGRAVVVFQVQGAGGAVPGDVQHVGRAAVQFGPDRRRGGERHHPDVGGVLAGGADRGQHVAQFPLIIQHRPAAGVGGGDRDHDPQRPRQHPPRCRVRLPVQADQRVQRQRAAAIRAGQGLPRQPGQLRRHGQAEPHRLMRPLRRRQHPRQLVCELARAGTTRPAAGRPGPATAHRRAPGSRAWARTGRPTRARDRRVSLTASARPARTPP